MNRFSLILLFLTIPFFLAAQTSPEKMASGKMDKKKWQKTGASLHKAYAKDSLDPELHYLLALYFFTERNPAYNIDSAYAYSKSAWRKFGMTVGKERERLKKVPLDSIHLAQLSTDIDSAAFEKAKKANTETSYQYFIDRYTTAPQVAVAVELRDEVAFTEALKGNTWQSFQKFMTKYPASLRKPDAQSRYDKLLYEDKTKDQKLSSFIKFHKEFPESPFRPLAEKNIFELSTVSGLEGAFRWFVINYPASPWSKRAKNIVYKLQTEETGPFNPKWMTDSLRQIEKLNQKFWVPVIKSGRYGFIDEEGAEVLLPEFENISEDYRCGDIHDRLLATSRGLVARNRAVIWSGKIRESKEIGSGFVLVSVDSGKFLIHESGFRVVRGPVEDAQVIVNRYLAIQKKKKWLVISLTGKTILPFAYDEISSLDTLIILSKGPKKILTTPMRIAAVFEKQNLREEPAYDEVKPWAPHQYWVRSGALEGVVDANLLAIVPLDKQSLRKTSFGYVRGKDDRFFVKGLKSLEGTPYKSIHEQGGWVKLKGENNKQSIYDKGFSRLAEGDSAWFQGQIAFLQTGDSVRAYLPSGQKLSFFGRSSFQFREFRDSSAWIVLEEKKKKVVYDAASGAKLFMQDFDQIEPVSPNIFLITKAGKKGLVTEDGKVLLPVEYDAIVSTDQNSFSVLKEKKFGWFDPATRSLIKPVYDRNIKVYSKGLRLAYREKGYGFILPDGKPLGANEWEDVQYWTDSTAWVKKNFQWILFNVYAQTTRLDKVRDFSVVADTPAEKIYIVHQENSYGVISTKHGIIVPIQYSDIVNLGNREVPMYFTERHIEEAGISVVVYYDHTGKNVRRQAMEAEEFERIYCDN